MLVVKQAELHLIQRVGQQLGTMNAETCLGGAKRSWRKAGGSFLGKLSVLALSSSCCAYLWGRGEEVACTCWQRKCFNIMALKA